MPHEMLTVSQRAFTGQRVSPSVETDYAPDPADILAALQSGESSAETRRRSILAAETLAFDADLAASLKPLLRTYIDGNFGCEPGDEAVAVASAVRKYVALLRVDELPTLADLLRAERKAAPWFEMEVAKMVTRKLTAILPEDTAALGGLGDQLMDMADGYSTPRMLPKRYCGAVALDSMLSLALLRSPHLPALNARLAALSTGWFKTMVARQAQVLKAELSRRFGADRRAPAVAALDALTVAASAAAG